eukprot:CAMPEP_0178937762 /NCGR_PEP_ID=MMETSP0786-20121207/25948_1 /TAXON_ID=186022 /ORGANISM="Thalassionema frauenfeldii, Strain CCMP 1798" /LENGTH=249 /DNA_ID=CAMNT_0020616391 /DNA_START=193 /DNA_END=943 /DNA_ORIENTATION=+
MQQYVPLAHPAADPLAQPKTLNDNDDWTWPTVPSMDPNEPIRPGLYGNPSGRPYRLWCLHAKELDGFLQWMTDRDYTLTAVWQTHAHLDHVAGLGLLAGSTSTAMDVPIYLHEKERTIYNSFDDRCREFGFHVEGGAAAAAALPKDTELTYLNDDSQQLSLGNLTFDIVHTPGHSPGHLGFLCDGMFFGGDFIMKGSIGRTDFPTSNDADMQKSLQRFVQTIPEDTLIFPGHGPPTSLKEEKEINPFLR